MSNREGVAQLAAALAPEGYSVGAVALRDCLHLKSAVTWIAPQAVLLNPAWVDRDAFGDVEVIEVDAAEPFAANTLTVAGTTLVSADYLYARAARAPRHRHAQPGCARAAQGGGRAHLPEPDTRARSLTLARSAPRKLSTSGSVPMVMPHHWS